MRDRLRKSDFLTEAAYMQAVQDRKTARIVEKEVKRLQQKKREFDGQRRYHGNKLKSAVELQSIPENVRDVMSQLDSGEEVVITVPSEFKAKKLPALSDAYNTSLYAGSRKGKPPKYTPRKLGQKVDGYFDSCHKKQRPPTITGLMLWLGLQRETFYYYLGHPQFGPIMMYARDRMENWLEEKLITMTSNPTGVIFALKNRHGWKDVQTTEINHSNLSESELLARIAALAPELATALGHQNVIEAEVVQTALAVSNGGANDKKAISMDDDSDD